MSVSPTSRSRLPLRLLLEAYAGGPLPEWEALADVAIPVHLDVGEDLFRAGDVTRDVYVLWRGLLRSHNREAGSPDYTVAFIEENQIIASASGLMSEGLARLIRSGVDPRCSEFAGAASGQALATLTALEPSDLLQLPFETLSDLIQRHPAWAALAMTLMIAQTIEFGGVASRARALTVEENYAFLLRHRPSLIRRLSQRELARYLGVTEPGMSRIIKRFRAAQSDPPLQRPKTLD